MSRRVSDAQRWHWEHVPPSVFDLRRTLGIREDGREDPAALLRLVSSAHTSSGAPLHAGPVECEAESPEERSLDRLFVEARR
jgi:hypothetical protein